MKRNVVFIILMTVLFFSPSVYGHTKYRLTYKQCVEMALKNNDQIRAAMQDKNQSQAKALEANVIGVPVIKYHHRVAPSPKDVDNVADSILNADLTVFNNFRVEMGIPVSSFGKLKVAKQLAALGIDAAELKRQKTANEVAFKMYQTYQGILLARDLLGLASQAQEALGGKIEALQNEKINDQLQILKLKVALYEVERKVEEAKNKKVLAYAAMKFLTGLEDDVDFEVAQKSLRPERFRLKKLGYYVNRAKENMPEFKLLEKGVQAKQKQHKLEKLKPLPNLGVGGFFDVGRAPGTRGEDETAFTNPFNFTKGGVGLELRGEFDFVKTRSKIKQSKADLLKTIYQKRAAIRGLELDIQRAYQGVVGSRNLMRKAEEEKKAARQMVFLTKSNIDIGLGNKKDYYDALQSYLVFQGRQLEAFFRYNVAIAELRNKIGELYIYDRKDS